MSFVSESPTHTLPAIECEGPYSLRILIEEARVLTSPPVPPPGSAGGGRVDPDGEFSLPGRGVCVVRSGYRRRGEDSQTSAAPRPRGGGETRVVPGPGGCRSSPRLGPAGGPRGDCPCPLPLGSLPGPAAIGLAARRFTRLWRVGARDPLPPGSPGGGWRGCV